KKILAALLAVMMVLSLVPMTALAAEGDPEVEAYGFVWDADKYKADGGTTTLTGGYHAAADWMGETMYVVLKESTAAGKHLWFEVTAGEDVWGCAATTSNLRMFAFSFLNRTTQWEQVPEGIEVGNDKEHATEYLKDKNVGSVTLKVYETEEEFTKESHDASALTPFFTETVAIAEGEDTMVKIVSAPSKPNSISKAILHDTTGAVPDNAINGSYDVAVTEGGVDEELGCYVRDVVVSATMLKPQGNAQDPAVSAYWTGFAALPHEGYADAGINKMKFVHVKEASQLDAAWAKKETTDLWGAVANGKNGFARYMAKDTEAELKETFNNTLVRLQWYKDTEPVGEAETYRLNFDGVKFDPTPVTITSVAVKNEAGNATVDDITATASFENNAGTVKLAGLMPEAKTTYTLVCATSAGGSVKVKVEVTPGAGDMAASYTLEAVANSAVVEAGNKAFYVVNNEYSVDLSGLQSTEATLAKPGTSGSVAPNLENHKDALADTTTQTTATGLTALVVAADPKISTEQQAAEDALKKNNEIDTNTLTTITVVVQPFLQVDVTGYNPNEDSKELSVDISAFYREVGVATSGTFDSNTEIKVVDEVESNANAMVFGNPTKVEVNDAIELSVKLPTSFANDNDELYVKHVKAGKTYYYKAIVKNDSAVFTSLHGLSPFTIMKSFTPQAQIGGTYYETLQEAVDAVANGGTITILANEVIATVGRVVSFTVNAGEKTYTINPGIGFKNNATQPAFEIVRDSSGGSVTPPSGGSSGTSGNITVTKPANGTMTSNVSSAKEGDKVTVTVKPDAPYYIVTGVTVKGENGNVVATKNADGTYSFTMPKGSVSVSATISHIYNLFKDVPTDIAEYGTAIKWAVEKGITLGTDTVAYSTFSPYNPCTRSQMVVFLYRAAGNPAVSGTNAFTDVPGDAEIQKAVQWAVSKGITKGTSDTTFDPYAPCTRGQMVTFLHRNHSEPAATGSNSFADVPADAFYKDAVQWAVNEGITKGTGDTTFAPNDACTRVQMVTFLYRDMGK
ncbi:S-layer homology domain-containing protein, partial [Oscillospiraceae bacterium 21-37]